MSRLNYQALGRLKTGVMNRTEAAYAATLENMRVEGKIRWFKFEGLKFRLANKTFYSPDFAVMNANCEIEIHEVKGFMLDDANVKIKIAADMYPFAFKIIRKIKGGWDIKDVA